jgi:hypothetical protein
MAKEDDKQSRQEEAKETRAVVDRLEDGGMAVLLTGKDGKTQVDVPLSLLPEGAKDGDHLVIKIGLDKQSRASAEERVRKLQDELKKQSGTEEKKDFKL